MEQVMDICIQCECTEQVWNNKAFPQDCYVGNCVICVQLSAGRKCIRKPETESMDE